MAGSLTRALRHPQRRRRAVPPHPGRPHRNHIYSQAQVQGGSHCTYDSAILTRLTSRLQHVHTPLGGACTHPAPPPRSHLMPGLVPGGRPAAPAPPQAGKLAALSGAAPSVSNPRP